MSGPIQGKRRVAIQRRRETEPFEKATQAPSNSRTLAFISASRMSDSPTRMA